MSFEEERSNISTRCSSPVKEKQIISLLMRDYDSQMEIMDTLRNDHFVDYKRVEIFELIKELYLNNRTINVESVRSMIELRTANSAILLNEFNDIISLGVKSETENKIFTSENVLADLEEMFKNRVVYNDIVLESNRRFTNNEPINDIIGYISDRLLSIEIGKKSISTKDAVRDVIEEIVNPSPKDYGLMIGIDEIDTQFGGFQKDRYWTVAAESKAGKTATIIDWIHRLCHFHSEDIAILFFSCEMSEKRIMRRLISRDVGFSEGKMAGRLKKLTKQEIDTVVNSGKKVKDYPLTVEYGTTDINKMKMKARRFALKNKGKHLFFVLDHIGKISENSNDLRHGTIKASSCMKSFCMDYNGTSITLSQLRKEIKSQDRKRTYHMPNLGDIMESGSIEADSDVILLIWRPDMYFKNISFGGDEEWDCVGKMILMNEKNRDGISPTHIVLDHDIKCNKLDNPENPFI